MNALYANLRIVLLFLIMVPFSARLGLAANVQSTPLAQVDLKKHADEKYRALFKSFSTVPYQEEAFWQIGMALDTMIDYCSTNNHGCSDLGEIALEIFNLKSGGTKRWWWDDFGWWGWAFIRLYEQTKKPEYLDAAKKCFNNMMPAKNAYKACQEYFKFAEIPRFENGCYNTNLNVAAKELEGIQNTVTNAQFLRLSLALFRQAYQAYTAKPVEVEIAPIKAYWNEAMGQYQWFVNWFKEGLMDISGIANDHILIKERVSTYRMGEPTRGDYANRFWIGDQGLMMAIFTDLLTLHKQLSLKNPLVLDISPLNQELIKKHALSISKGVKKHLVNHEGLLSVFKKDGKDPFPFGDEDDYITGPGVYLTSMIHGAKNNDELNAKFKAAGYNLIIQRNAAAAMDNPTTFINQVSSFNRVANELAALNAALLIQ